jgi:hypothetical protein
MSIKQNGGVFGRNPTFNDVTIEGDLIINGEVFTGLDFQGSWNASTNSPTLASSVGTNGEFYIVSVAGGTNLNGITNWGIGDWAIFNGTAWQRVEGGADGNFNDVTVAGTLGVTGQITANGGIALGDNDKATFGASDDLQIFHNATDSYIVDTGTGNLNIKGSNLYLRANNNDAFIYGIEDGPVRIYHDNYEKFITTATGIDVTGTATMDGLTVDGTATVTGDTIKIDSATHAFYTADRGDASSYAINRYYTAGTESWRAGLLNDGTSNFHIYDVAGSGDRLSIGTNGDISFYEDTGTTAKLFWDASAESLGIGTSTPATALSVVGDITTTGGVYLGGTVAANLLDDYETGSFTPTVYGATTAGTGTYTIQTGFYEKIGSLVHFQIYLTWTALDGTGELLVGGLPFSSSSDSNMYTAISSYVSAVALTANNVAQGFLVNRNATSITCKEAPVGGGVASGISMDGAGTMVLSGTYRSV